MAHNGQARRARQHHADLPAFPRPGAEPSREHLAVSPPELALKHRLRKLRRNRRRRMRRLAKPHRSTRNDHVHRNARLGSRRSAAMTLGIIGGCRSANISVAKTKRTSCAGSPRSGRGGGPRPGATASRAMAARVRANVSTGRISASTIFGAKRGIASTKPAANASAARSRARAVPELSARAVDRGRWAAYLALKGRLDHEAARRRVVNLLRDERRYWERQAAP